MAPFKKFIALAIMALALIGAGFGQSTDRDQYTPNASEKTALAFTYRHIETYQHFGNQHAIEVLWGSAPTTATIAINGVMRGGTSTPLTTSSLTTNQVLQVVGNFDFIDVVVSWTGTPSSQKINISGFAGPLLTPAVNIQGMPVMGILGPIAPQDGTSNATFRANILSDGNAYGQMVAPEQWNGATWDKTFYCPNTTLINAVASTTTQLVPLSSGLKIRICSASLNPSTVTAGSMDLVYGTGASCGTGTTSLTGPFTVPASAVVAIPITPSSTGALITPAGQAICMRTVTSTANGFITWAQY